QVAKFVILTSYFGPLLTITQQRNKDMMDLLRYILPEHHDFFKSLPHTQNVDEQ
ncbi:hypothetical protein ALC60_05715, partial [Trachymyrmex zeteki]